MGDDPGAAQPTREQLEEQLREARRQEHESLVEANRLYVTASQAEAERAFAQHQAWLDEIARLERELTELDQPREDILGDLDAQSQHAAVLAGIGGGEGQTAEQAQAESNRRNRRILVGLAASGSLLALAILAWLAWQQGQLLPSTMPTSTSGAQASPTGAPSPTGPSSPALATASPAPPKPSPLPLSERPASGSSFGIGAFLRTSGSCPIADEFTAEFTLEATDGQAVMTQLPFNHVTTGTLTRTGPSSGQLVLSADGQRYEANVAGNLVIGSHLYTQGGCNDTYDFRMYLDRALLAPPPFGDARAYFQFVADDGEDLIDMNTDLAAAESVLLQSRDGLGMNAALPIEVILHVGDGRPWHFRIESYPPTPVAIPPHALAALLDANTQPMLVATAGGDDVLAVYAPHDINWELAWIAQLLAE